ncbi:MAG: AcrR family transcriptional regulator, partial [Candidatus Poriferisodalaceae bacterium]
MRVDAKRTRAAILNAARQVLCSTSIDAMTMQAIIDESGVSKAQVYRHYRTPNVVIVDLAAGIVEAIKEEMMAHPEEAAATPAAAYARAA